MMFRMKTFTDGIFVHDEEMFEFAGFKRDTRERNKPFAQKEGCCWTLARLVLGVVFPLCHLVLAVVFLFFFVTALSFGINCALDMTFEMIYPVGDSISRRNIMSVCMSVMLFCVLMLVCLALSLFWEALRAVLFKTTLNANVARMVLVFLILIVSGIWAGSKVPPTKSMVYFPVFIKHAIIISWLFAFALSLLGAIISVAFVYTESKRNKIARYTSVTVAVILVIFAILSCIVFRVIVDSSKGAIAFGFLLPFGTALLVMYTYFRGINKERKSFIINWRVSLLYIAAYLAVVTLFVSTVTTQTKCDIRCHESLLSKAWAAANQPTPFPNASRYPICTQTWSSSRLNIADMALLANLTYNAAMFGDNTTHKESTVNQYFTSRGITWSAVSASNSAPYFYHIKGANNIHVIGIRGAKGSEELIGCAKLWDEIAVLQSISVMFSIVPQLPLEFIAEYVARSSFVDKLFHHGSTRHYFQSLEDYVGKVAKTNSEVFLVGHSLGGGIAKIIAARKQIPAVTFSSPGIGYSYKKFDFTLKNAALFTTTIRPEKDVIPLIDRLYGEVQYIDCDGDDFVECHTIEKTYCELRSGCNFAALPRCPNMLYSQ